MKESKGKAEVLITCQVVARTTTEGEPQKDRREKKEVIGEDKEVRNRSASSTK